MNSFQIDDVLITDLVAINHSIMGKLIMIENSDPKYSFLKNIDKTTNCKFYKTIQELNYDLNKVNNECYKHYRFLSFLWNDTRIDLKRTFMYLHLKHPEYELLKDLTSNRNYQYILKDVQTKIDMENVITEDSLDVFVYPPLITDIKITPSVCSFNFIKDTPNDINEGISNNTSIVSRKRKIEETFYESETDEEPIGDYETQRETKDHTVEEPIGDYLNIIEKLTEALNKEKRQNKKLKSEVKELKKDISDIKTEVAKDYVKLPDLNPEQFMASLEEGNLSVPGCAQENGINTNFNTAMFTNLLSNKLSVSLDIPDEKRRTLFRDHVVFGLLVQCVMIESFHEIVPRNSVFRDKNRLLRTLLENIRKKYPTWRYCDIDHFFK